MSKLIMNVLLRPILFLKIKDTILLFLLAYSSIYAQNNSNQFFFSGHEIVVDVLPGNDIFYSQAIDKGITIYSLARIFQVDTYLVYSLNKLDPKLPISEGKTVKIPIAKNLIVFDPNFKEAKQPHLPIYYEVKKGESLYRIAKEYFNTDIKNILSNNEKQNIDIKVGEKLLIGWFPLIVKNNVEVKTSHDVVAKNKITTNNTLDSSSTNLLIVPEKEMITTNVIALWDKQSTDRNNLFVLHNDAKIGSQMKIYFPMLRREMSAKVLGRIPSGTYKNDISLFLSPTLAKSLGILDARCKVQITYEK